MQYSWSKISLWSTEKWNYFGFNQFWNVIFRTLEIQYLTYVVGTQKNLLNETVLLSTQNVC